MSYRYDHIWRTKNKLANKQIALAGYDRKLHILLFFINRFYLELESLITLLGRAIGHMSGQGTRL